jgi:hypothetical protein
MMASNADPEAMETLTWDRCDEMLKACLRPLLLIIKDCLVQVLKK